METIIYKFLVSSDSSISDETKQKYINKIFTNPKIIQIYQIYLSKMII